MAIIVARQELPLKPPRPKSHFPDRELDCECEVESHVQSLLEEGTTLGWQREEKLEALMQVARAMQLADSANELVDDALTRTRKFQRH
jgi:hypothetical protein